MDYEYQYEGGNEQGQGIFSGFGIEYQADNADPHKAAKRAQKLQANFAKLMLTTDKKTTIENQVRRNKSDKFV